MGPQGERGELGQDGEDGTDCTVVRNADDTGVIVACGDSQVEVFDGEDGAIGLPGAPGAPGQNGANGAPGQDGTDGNDGMPGQNGEDGAPGEDGASCTVVRNADETGVIVTCGDSQVEVFDGEDGAPGESGQNGAPGQDGTDGNDGANGAVGPQGEPGLDGLDGAIGQDGQDGAPGQPGANGRDGVDGAQGPQGEPGPAGSDGQDLVAVCPDGSEGLTFNGNLMYCAEKLIFPDPKTWVQCLDECLQVGLFLAKEADLAVICLGDPNFFIEDETVGEDVDSTPGTCDDGMDNLNDEETLVDCADPACASALNCDTDVRYHFESVDSSAGKYRLDPFERVPLLADSNANLCEQVTEFQAGDQLSQDAGDIWSRFLLAWNQFQETVASSFADDDAELSANANPRRCLCGKRL